LLLAGVERRVDVYQVHALRGYGLEDEEVVAEVDLAGNFRNPVDKMTW